MTSFGKISLVSVGAVLFWTAFAAGLDLLSRGQPTGLVGIGAFLALLLALTTKRFRAYLRTLTDARTYPARVFAIFLVFLLIFAPKAMTIANDPLALINSSITRALIYAAVAAGLAVVALLVNAAVYLISDRQKR